MNFPALLASEGGAVSFDLMGIMGDAVATVQGDIFGVLALVVPALVAVVGAVVGVRFGVKWLRSLGKG